MSTTAKASDHVKPCNIEQSERHNRRNADYIASLNPRTLYVRTELSHNNESYVVPDLKGVTLQHHYDAIKAMVKQKTGRAMQEKKVTVIGKNGKRMVNRKSVMAAVPSGRVLSTSSLTPQWPTSRSTQRKCVKDGESEPSRYISTKMRVTIPTLMIRQPGNPIFMHTSSGTG